MEKLSPQETIRRLKVLRQKMVEVRDTKAPFNIGEWFFPCGTPSCVLGHACEIPEFEAMGLRRVEKKTTRYATRFYVPEFAGDTQEDAGATFFGLSYDDARRLFMPGCYGTIRFSEVTPDMVVARINEIISEVKDATDK